jgi:hypothetical protein
MKNPIEVIYQWFMRRALLEAWNEYDHIIKTAQYQLCQMRQTENPGLLQHHLFKMPNVVEVSFRGGWMDFVAVTMDDHYEVSSSGVLFIAAYRKAGLRVVRRLRERFRPTIPRPE